MEDKEKKRLWKEDEREDEKTRKWMKKGYEDEAEKEKLHLEMKERITTLQK